MAQRVTAELLAIKPYVFPAPKPEPKPVYASDASTKKPRDEFSKPSKPSYPCELCAGAVPVDYCHTCKAEWDRRKEEEREREEKKRLERNTRQRQRYSRYKRRSGVTHCSNCGGEVRAKRKDAKYCCAACRQKAYLARGGKGSNFKPLDRAYIERELKAIFEAEPDSAFWAGGLCCRVYPGVPNPERKHRVALLAACKRLGLGLFRSDRQGGLYLVFNLASLMSYAVARKKSWGYARDTEESIRAGPHLAAKTITLSLRAELGFGTGSFRCRSQRRDGHGVLPQAARGTRRKHLRRAEVMKDIEDYLNSPSGFSDWVRDSGITANQFMHVMRYHAELLRRRERKSRKACFRVVGKKRPYLERCFRPCAAILEAAKSFEMGGRVRARRRQAAYRRRRARGECCLRVWISDRAGLEDWLAAQRLLPISEPTTATLAASLSLAIADLLSRITSCDDETS